MSKRTQRHGLVRTGVVITFVAVLLALMGLSASPAGADKPGTFKVTLCHRTNAPTNPYREITVSVDASDGTFVGPDHTGHPGPVFDFTGGTVYDTPRDGDQWGDIIPAFEFDGGSYPGSEAWQDEGGPAVLEGHCQGPEEVDDPVCPAGQVWDDKDDSGTIDPGECVTPIECPEGTEWVDANENGIEEEGECETPETPEAFECPADTDWVDTNGDDLQQESECNEVLGEVITPTPEPEAAPADELPQTGTSTLPLTLAATGLLLVGAGLTVIARDRVAAFKR